MGLDRLFIVFTSITVVCWVASILPTPLPPHVRIAIAVIGCLTYAAALLGQKVRD